MRHILAVPAFHLSRVLAWGAGRSTASARRLNAASAWCHDLHCWAVGLGSWEDLRSRRRPGATQTGGGG